MPENIPVIYEEYRRIQPLLTKFEKEVFHILDEIITENKLILAFPITSRIKSWQSIEEKISRLDFHIRSVTGFRDLVGFRIVLLFPREISIIEQKISETFTLIKKIDTSMRLKEDQFGYSSHHLIIGIPEKWWPAPNWIDIHQFIAEIQVRTLSQHLWAEISHKLQYKQSSTVPFRMKRIIYRISAFLESVDGEIENILVEKDKLQKEFYSEGKVLTNPQELDDFLSIILSPENRDEDEDYSSLLSELQNYGLDNVGKLRTFIEKYREYMEREDDKQVSERLRMIEKEPIRDQIRLTELSAYYGHVGLVRLALIMEYKLDKVDPPE